MADKSAFDVVHAIAKADRRFSDAPRAKPSSYTARHATAPVSSPTPLRDALSARGLRTTLRATKIGRV